MKKMLTVCLCLLLITALAVPVFAANETTFTASLSATTLYRGDTVSLTVNVTSAENATSYGLELDYDAAVFELVEGSGSCAVPGALVNSFNNGFAFMFQNPTAYSGAVGTVTLKVKDDAAFGTTAVTGAASVKNGTTDVASTGCTVSLTIACEHSYGAWTESGTGHAKTCSVCGDVQTAAHTWNKGDVTEAATCTKEGTKTFTCTTCTAAKTEVIEMVKHTYGAWVSADDNNHKHICSVCQKEESEAHTFAQELTAGEQSHWNACACGMKKNETAHTYDEKVWAGDEKTHWHSCACGAKDKVAEHIWDEGKVTTEATQKKEGVKTYTCKDCAAEKTEAIPVVPTNPQTGDETLVVPFVLLMVLSACGIVVCAIARKRAVR